ncbi:MAG: trypsin-like serine peptidase [Myxococcota bacterium]
MPQANEPEPEPANAPGEERPSSYPFPDFRMVGDDDFAVRIVTGSVTCSGALVANDRVLTAHHCVAVRSAKGDIEEQEVEPSAVRVELGGDLLPWGEVEVRAIVAPTCGHAGGVGDLAILVLSRPLRGIPARHVDLDNAPAKGDSVVPIGFGRCADANDGIYRKKRVGSPVHKVFDGRVELDAAICPGDSGGPAVSEATGKIVGVVSRSVMDSNEATLGATELARLDTFRPLFAAAAQIAAGVSPSELPPIECRR